MKAARFVWCVKNTHLEVCNVKITNLEVCNFSTRFFMENYKPLGFVCGQMG